VRGSDAGGQRPIRPFDAEQAWRATAGRAAGCVMCFDLDGTLAPVEDDPAAVRPVPAALEAIRSLAGSVRRVAIVSARPVDFLRSRFAGVDADLYGLYGLEHARGDGPTVTEPAALPYVPEMDALAQRARSVLPPHLVEFKRLSVALHWRTAPSLASTVQAWAADEAARLGLRVQTGRMVVELKPPVDRDKGYVLGEVVESASCAWYFGDDVSDLKAFQALRDREARDPSFFGVCAAVANPETGRDVAEAADLTFASPEALADFLTTAAHSLDGHPG
jgi:trehalose 6-phosphate phosphatase